MRVLVLTSVVPYPPHGGGHARMYAVLRHLCRDHSVDLIALARPGDMVHREGLERLCHQVTFLPAPPGRAGLRRWARSAKNLVLLRAFDADSGIRRAVEDSADAYDLIQVENAYMMPYVDSIQGIPKTLDIFGTLAGGTRRDFAAQETLAGRLRVIVTWLKTKWVERRLSRQFDAVYVVSEMDRAYLAAIDPRLRIYVVSNGVDTDRFLPESEPPPPPVHLVFTGAMDYTANEHAVLFFYREILPRIAARLPEVRVWLVGRDPGPRLAALAQDPRVSLTGAVEDVRPYLVRATVVVVPMRLGSGTRIKILEALAMGKAVVPTRTGAEGLRVAAGRHLVIADEPTAFAAEVLRLAQDPAERRRLGREGRVLVEAEYDWRVVLAPMSQAVNEVAGRRRVGTWAH